MSSNLESCAVEIVYELSSFGVMSEQRSCRFRSSTKVKYLVVDFGCVTKPITTMFGVNASGELLIYNFARNCK